MTDKTVTKQAVSQKHPCSFSCNWQKIILQNQQQIVLLWYQVLP